MFETTSQIILIIMYTIYTVYILLYPHEFNLSFHPSFIHRQESASPSRGQAPTGSSRFSSAFLAHPDVTSFTTPPSTCRELRDVKKMSASTRDDGRHGSKSRSKTGTYLEINRNYNGWKSLVEGIPSETYESQLGWLFPIYGKYIKDPNTTNQV